LISQYTKVGITLSTIINQKNLLSTHIDSLVQNRVLAELLNSDLLAFKQFKTHKVHIYASRKSHSANQQFKSILQMSIQLLIANY